MYNHLLTTWFIFMTMVWGWKYHCVANILDICILQTSEEGAQTTIHCAVQEGIERHSGKYFADCHLANPHPKSQDDVAAKKLWELSEQLVNSVS